MAAGIRRAVVLAVLTAAFGAFTLQQRADEQLIEALVIDLVAAVIAVLALWPRTRWLAPSALLLVAAGIGGQFTLQAEPAPFLVLLSGAALTWLVLLAIGVALDRWPEPAAPVSPVRTGDRRRTRILGLGGLVLLLGIGTVLRYQDGQLYQALVTDLVVAIIAVLVLWPKVRWLLPGIIPLLVASVLGQFASQSHASIALVVTSAAGLTFLILLSRGVDVNRRIDRAVHVGGRWIEGGIGALAFVLVVIPGWAWTRLRRHDPLASEPGWTIRQGDAATTAPASLAASAAVVAPRRTLIGRLSWAVGCVVLLLAVDFGVGYGWDRTFPTDAADEPVAKPASNAIEGEVPRDPRNDSPAMAAYPWRAQYFDEIQRTPGGYWPFTEYRPSDYAAKYVNQEGWVRRSYEPKGDPDTMPAVWMFGGSTTWGEGQRDGYTIASWLARMAEEDGIPIQIQNYGARGWTHFQEMVLYEQQLAQLTPPDLAVFYDGLNEVTTQSLLEEAVPSHTLVQQYAKALTGRTVATELLQEPSRSGSSLLAEVRAKYEQHSATAKLVEWVTGTPAGASPAQDPEEIDPAFTAQDDEDGAISDYKMTVQDGVDAGKVYERGKAFTLMLSEKYGVDPLLFWQPARYNGPPQQAAIDQLTSPTIDISTILEDHDDLFIDGGHTNEEGARICAAAIWKRLEPRVRAWYRDHA